MMKFILRWDAGYGEEYEVIEAKNQLEANKAAYEAWKDTVESNADYEAMEWTEELEEELI